MKSFLSKSFVVENTILVPKLPSYQISSQKRSYILEGHRWFCLLETPKLFLNSMNFR